MWCEKIERNVAETMHALPAHMQVEFIDLAWNECTSLVKARTTAGEPVRVLLPRGRRVGHGDVIYEEECRIVIIRVSPCEVVVAHTADARESGILGMELGNLHLPVQIDAGEFVFVEEARAMEMLEARGILWKKEIRLFEPMYPLCAPAVHLAENFRLIRGGRAGVQDGDEPLRVSCRSASQVTLTD